MAAHANTAVASTLLVVNDGNAAGQKALNANTVPSQTPAICKFKVEGVALGLGITKVYQRFPVAFKLTVPEAGITILVDVPSVENPEPL